MRGNVTQKELAARMNERGYNWVTATVWAAEAGRRDIKIDEAKALVDILGTDLNDFFADTEHLRAANDVYDQISKLESKLHEVSLSVESFLYHRWYLKFFVEQCGWKQGDIHLRYAELQDDDAVENMSQEDKDALEVLQRAKNAGEVTLERHTLREAIRFGHSGLNERLKALDEVSPAETDDEILDLFNGATEER